jgi:hypothetical protein
VSRRAVLLCRCPDRHADCVEEEQGIYRGEVRAMMLALADIRDGVDRILGYLEGEDDEEEEEEDFPDA